MKRKFLEKEKKICAIALSMALAIPAISVCPSVVSAATAEGDEPQLVASYDFEGGIEAIEGAEIANSETVYVVKKAGELAEGEKLDANGLVYTGEGADAKYVTKDTIGAPSVISADDNSELGNVLQFDDTTIQVDEYRKNVSAKTDDMSEETAKALDTQMPRHDYYYVESGSVELAPIRTQNISPELKLANPFAGLAESLKEYEETEDVDVIKYNGKYVPKWNKGVTISYWIKVPVDENGVYQNSSVLRWENDNEYYLQADDYARYLPTKLWDQQYGKLDDEKKEEGLKSSPSGIINYGLIEEGEGIGTYKDPDGLMDYYFDYAEGYYTKDENGHFVPTIFTANDGSKGPVYDYALIQKMQASYKGKTQYTGSARFFYANPNYQDGFYVAADGSATAMYAIATYDTYSKLPDVVNADGTVTHPTTSYVRLEDGQTIAPGESNLRYALEDGELQIDADDSVFWVPDNIKGINENSNVKASYLSQAGMQNGDVFFMNSWRESSENDSKGNGTYSSASYVADSPVSYNNVKNANAGKWHHVAITMQNDWVEFYVDGEMVGVEDNYSSRGATTLDTKTSFKRFNKGAGMRNGAGSEKYLSNFSYGVYVCRLLMDWISDENSVLCLGGIGNYAGGYYAQAATTSKVCIDELKFYNGVLDEDEIKEDYGKEPVEAVQGDVNRDGVVSLSDAKMVFKFALAIVEPSEDAKMAADMNCDSDIDLDDVLCILKIALELEDI